ncbi:NlpC/P60 family protein [Streptomyces sp. NPDC048514]|uniref:C40 family peptidase n=1 Tax=Streptomyces sp. NPDC048514 TaxID=3365564 RepID=UPI00371E1238
MAPESRDEVRQRIDSLYHQAETATGTFNATRALAANSRARGVPLAKRRGRRPDPELDEVARQWFDAARAKLGPTVPAALPADRLPEAPARSRGPAPDGFPPGSALEPWGGGRPGTGLPSGERPALDPGPAGRLPELERGADRATAALEPGAGPAVAALEPGTGPAMAALAPGAGPAAAEPTAGTSGLVANRPFAALETGRPAPVAAPRTARGTSAQPQPLGPHPGSGAAPGAAASRSRAALSKSGSRRKLAEARALLAGYTGRGAVSGSGVQAAPAANAWDTGAQPVVAGPARVQEAARIPEQWQQPRWTAPGEPAVTTAQPVTDVATTGGSPTYPAGPAPTTGIGSFSYPGTTDTGSLSALTDTGAFTAPGTGAFPNWNTADTGPLFPLTDTGAFTAPGTGAFPNWNTADTGPLSPLTDTGAFAAPVIDTAALPDWGADTGSLSGYTDTGSYAHLGAAASPLPAPVPESPRALRAAKAIAFARAQLGKPCVWGATGPDSYDCSSLTQAAWKAAGVTLPRAAHRQALAGTPVTLAGLEPGDLVLFFDDDRHVGLHVGDGMMVHAPGPGSTITEESIYGAGEAAIHRITRPA